MTFPDRDRVPMPLGKSLKVLDFLIGFPCPSWKMTLVLEVLEITSDTPGNYWKSSTSTVAYIPLYLRSVWRYMNVVLLLIIIIEYSSVILASMAFHIL